MKTKSANIITKKAQGAIVGAAIGDALGMPTECVSRDRFQSMYGGTVRNFYRAHAGHACDHLRAGQYTDDTQQVILLSETLIEHGGFNIDEFGVKIGKWGHYCINKKGYDRWAGRTSLSAASKLMQGYSAQESGSLTTLSCGSTMRVAPIGVFYRDIDNVIRMANQSSMVTHNSEISKSAAASIAAMVNFAMYREINPRDAIKEVLKIMKNTLFSQVLQEVIEVADFEPDDAARILGTGSSAKCTGGYALYCYLHSYDDFEQTIVNAANVDFGDSDSIACIAGALSGAYNSIDAIDKRFFVVEDFKKLMKIGKDLVK